MKPARALALCLIALLLPATGLSQQQKHKHGHAEPSDPKAYVAMLENPKRDAYQKPDQVIKALKIKRGEVIADIGAGSGYFSLRLAPEVGKSGRIYAVDVNPDLILHLNGRMRDLKMQNVSTILALPDDPLLADRSVDRFFICNTWHHIEDHPKYLGLMRQMLKPGGQVIMIDWKKTETPTGPSLEHRIDRDDLVKEMEANGFSVAAEHSFLPYQYFLIFKAK